MRNVNESNRIKYKEKKKEGFPIGKNNKKSNSIAGRMKTYERVSRNFLTRRTPAIVRVDGKAFRTFTKGLKKPFDDLLRNVMQLTMQYLCQNITGCAFGYTQSDEISLLLTDYETVSTEAWFGYNVEKMCSIAASMATLAFNRFWAEEVQKRMEEFSDNSETAAEEWAYLVDVAQPKAFTALFDARAFSLPKEDVCNYFIWRQQDATRNSIASVGQMYYSTQELNGRKGTMIQEMLWQDHGINWNDYPVAYKRGACCYKKVDETTMTNPRNPDQEIPVSRRSWLIDREPPIFTQDRDYIEKRL